MFIDGKWETGSAAFDVYNPATGDVVGSVADGSRADAARAIGAAARAFPGWSAKTAYARSEILYKAWQLMRERLDDLARTMTLEQGKPLRAARNEVGYAADFLLWFAEEAKRVYGRTIPAPRADQRFVVLHHPVAMASRTPARSVTSVGTTPTPHRTHAERPACWPTVAMAFWMPVRSVMVS